MDIEFLNKMSIALGGVGMNIPVGQLYMILEVRKLVVNKSAETTLEDLMILMDRINSELKPKDLPETK